MTSATGSPESTPASVFATELLAGLLQAGVRDVVLSPGSRSQALALAAARLAREGLIRLTVRIDERSAGFLALGLAVESRRPVAVIVTSGTAVANLHPAVLEAHHSAVPLLLLTADRPAELRGIGSNQTTHQPGFFGLALRWAEDVAAPTDEERPDALALAARAVFAATGPRPGPVQLNLAFREPLSGGEPPLPAVLRDAILPETAGEAGAAAVAAAGGATPASSSAATPVDARLASLTPVAGTVVIAGHGAGVQAEALARALDVPLLAEVSSGSRFGPQLVTAYRALLDEPAFGGAVRRAIVFGHPSLSRQVPALLQREVVEVVVVRSGGEDYDPGRRARIVDLVEAAPPSEGGPPDRSWSRRWVHASRVLQDARLPEEQPVPSGSGPDWDRAEQARFLREELDAVRAPVDRALLVDAVWRATWPHDRLVFASSRLIREADDRVPGKKISVHANRGLAGIDGTIATAWGVAIASQGLTVPSTGESLETVLPGTTRVVLGDLALLHDVGSLLAADGEQRPRLQLIVGNDRGGAIFEGLEVAGTAPEDDFRRVLRTPHRARLEQLAAAYDWDYRRAATRGELERAVTGAHTRPLLIEVPLDADEVDGAALPDEAAPDSADSTEDVGAVGA